MQLSSDEVERYRRHIALDEVGLAGQLALKAARVLIVGAGGLGTPVSLYLAAAGVGTIGIVDSDTVVLSNLQRQVLFNQADVGQSKVVAIAARLRELNSQVAIITHDVMFDNSNAESLLESYDLIVDCTDNFAARYAINDACLAQGKVFVYGSIYRFEGQVSVFCAANSPCYRCLYPLEVDQELIANCAEAGVLGALAGVVGSLQAAEVIKLILSQGKPLTGRLLLYDALAVDFSTITLEPSHDCICANAIRLEPNNSRRPAPAVEKATGSTGSDEILTGSDELSPDWLRQNYEDGEHIELLDVRTLQEHRAMRLLNDLHIPLDELSRRTSEIDRAKKIVIYCRSGIRSRKAVRLLREAGFEQVYNLSGGIMAWWRSFQDERIESDVAL
jgi:molybdopterin/thiamine biosynthesis adenylyltransferase/rhodanese-related sulfurtransferase